MSALDETLARMHADKLASRSIIDPDAELQAIRDEIEALRKRLDVVFWRFACDRERPTLDAIEEADDMLGEAIALVRMAIAAEPLTDDELRFGAICAANDARRGDVG